MLTLMKSTKIAFFLLNLIVFVVGRPSTQSANVDATVRAASIGDGEKRKDVEINETVTAKKADAILHEELTTTTLNKLRHTTPYDNDKDGDMEVTSKVIHEVNEDRELPKQNIPIFPPLPIVVRALMPLAFPPLDGIAVHTVPQPAIHISDRVNFHDSEIPEASSEPIEIDFDSPERVQKIMKSLVSDVFGSILKAETSENSSDLMNSQTEKESKRVDLQGKPYLMTSKMTQLVGKNGNFFLRFMSLRPLETGSLSENNETQNTNEEHTTLHDKTTAKYSKENTDSKAIMAWNGNGSLRNPRVLEKNHRIETEKHSASNSENITVQMRKKWIESADTLQTTTMDTSEADLGNSLKTKSSDIEPASSLSDKSNDAELADKNETQNASSNAKASTEDQRREKDSQLKLIQYYRSFIYPVLPVQSDRNSEQTKSEEFPLVKFRLKDVPLEGDVSMAPSVAEASPSVVIVKEVSPSVTDGEKVSQSAPAVAELKPSFSSSEKEWSSASNVKKETSSIPIAVKGTSPTTKVAKVSHLVEIASKVPPKFSKGDDQFYEDEDKDSKPIFFEVHSLALNNSKRGVGILNADANVSTTVGTVNGNKSASKVLSLPQKEDQTEISSKTEPSSRDQIVKDSNSVKEGNQKYLANNGKKNLVVVSKSTVHEQDEQKDANLGNITEYIKAVEHSSALNSSKRSVSILNADANISTTVGSVNANKNVSKAISLPHKEVRTTEISANTKSSSSGQIVKDSNSVKESNKKHLATGGKKDLVVVSKDAVHGQDERKDSNLRIVTENVKVVEHLSALNNSKRSLAILNTNVNSSIKDDLVNANKKASKATSLPHKEVQTTEISANTESSSGDQTVKNSNSVKKSDQKHLANNGQRNLETVPKGVVHLGSVTGSIKAATSSSLE